MHILPQLRKLEEQYGDWLVVVGVHSSKFPNERETANIRNAVLRNDIRHPVINDREFELWGKYGVRAWPTLMFVDPSGRVIGKHEGEFEFTQLDRLLDDMREEFEERGLVSRTPLEFQLEAEREAARPLSFPGKIEALPSQGLLAVSDSAHHRVLVLDEGGRVHTVVGSGEPGTTEGSFAQARFTFPQGIAVSDDGRALYVADAGDHTIRCIDLDSESVTIVAGTGEQALYRHRGGDPRSVPLNSPYDVALRGSTLFIAMAGFHQIWALDLDENRISPFAGDGMENIQDGPRLQAQLAQTFGLAVQEDRLFFADSETSALRMVGLDGDAMVETLVGIGLFDFGDQNGSFEHALFQHVEDVAVLDESTLIVADTYNHRIKRMDLNARTVSSLAGSGEAGFEDGPAFGAQFDEPSGVTLLNGRVYVADAGNHAIRVIDPERRTVSKLEVRR